MSAPLAPIPELLARIRADSLRNIDPAGRDISFARAPGRLDVMGGIADYTGSLVCEMPLQLATAVAFQPRHDRRITLKSYNLDAEPAGPSASAAQVELSVDDFWGTAALLPVETVRRQFTGPRRWAAYVAGAYYILAKHRKTSRRVSGANIACYSTLPVSAGVSSSAALEVAAISALADACHLLLEPLEVAVTGQRVEHQIVGAPCGIMDQVTSVFGRAGQLLLLECQPHTLAGTIDLSHSAGSGTIKFVGMHSGIKHSVAGDAYRHTRVAAFMAHAIIARAHQDFGARKDPTRGYLANVDSAMYRRYFRPILPHRIAGRDFLRFFGPTIDRVTAVDPDVIYFVRGAADHHVLENRRVRRFVDALQRGVNGDTLSLLRAGRLMLASHASYGRRAGLGSPETDLLVRRIMQRGPRLGFYGARITGGGSGGAVAILCADSAAVAEALQQIAAHYEQATGLKPILFQGSGPGAADSPVHRFAAADLLK